MSGKLMPQFRRLRYLADFPKVCDWAGAVFAGAVPSVAKTRNHQPVAFV